ncbi:MAG: SDR family NAD(P)-dependent oxidoreductase [Candidatus Neomarinimicrobiota bacterium]|nr:MAG: SDR family NAD(P)-dependent oxidoreductase [bacterium]|tara:strand:+ start:841 stop:1593 length:753 start_codon:yes stop_codon:yes gene_type:complete
MSLNIFITGASSGIGESLAYYYSRKQYTIGIAARRNNRLESVANECKKLGGNPMMYNIDVSDRKECKDAIEKFLFITKSIDIVIANAGIGGYDNILNGDPSEINKIYNINLLGVSNTVLPFIPKMKKQHSGRIAIISSIASFRGIPEHGGYSSSKAALNNLTDSWGYTLKPYGISLTTVLPGYIDTEMTKDHEFKMPFLMNSNKASEIIANSIQRKRRKLILPWQWKFIIPIFRILPRSLIFRFSPNQIK